MRDKTIKIKDINNDKLQNLVVIFKLESLLEKTLIKRAIIPEIAKKISPDIPYKFI